MDMACGGRLGARLKHLVINTSGKLNSPALNQLLISVPNLRYLAIRSTPILQDDLVRIRFPLFCDRSAHPDQVGVVADDCRELIGLEIANCPMITQKVVEYIARGTGM